MTAPIQELARSLLNSIYGDREALDKEQAAAVLQTLLGRVVDEQISALEKIGGLGAYPRDSLHALLSNAAATELTNAFGLFGAACEAEMKLRTGPPTPTEFS